MNVEEVVVTGTFIRGIAPVGSTVIGISEQEIQSSGVNDSNQVLGTLVPQSNFFMELPQPALGVAQGVARVPIDRPQLRNVGNPFNNSGSTTLVMMDGHRIVTAGLEQAGVDVGLIPPGMIERQEIILDGVSALYGSDAVAGVINYITRKRFDGMQVNAQYGVAEDYDATSVNATFGKSWDTGGIGLTYSFGENSSLYNRDRPYAITRNYLEGGRLTGLACEGYSHDSVGTGAALRRFVVTAGQTTFAEQTNWCASNGYATLSPAQERHAGFLTFSQDLTDDVTVRHERLLLDPQDHTGFRSVHHHRYGPQHESVFSLSRRVWDSEHHAAVRTVQLWPGARGHWSPTPRRPWTSGRSRPRFPLP